MADKIIIDITTKDDASKSISGIGAAVVSLNQGLELMKKAASAAVAPFASIVSEGADFSSRMAVIASISKSLEKDLGALTAEAERIGAATEFSASQAAGAMEELARSGMNSTQILNTTASAMALASATGADLSRSAGVMAVQLNQFSKEGLTAQKAADLIVKTVGASPQTFENMAEALETASGTASAFGIKFENLTQILGAMADAGVRGEKAGTALNGALARLANPTKSISDELAKLGLKVDEVNPLTNDFSMILGRLHDSGATAAQLLEILGQEAGPKFVKVIQQGGDVLKNFKKKQDEANSAAEAQEKRLNSLSGDWEKFNSAVGGVKLDVFKLLDPMLRNITKSATSMIDNMQKFFKANANNMADFLEGLAITVKGIEDFFSDFVKSNRGTFDDMWKTIKETFDEIAKALGDFWEENKETFGKIAEIVVSITSKFVTLASKITDALLPVLKPLGEILLDLLKIFLDFVNKGLDLVIDAVEEVTPLFKAFGTLLDTVTKPVINGVQTALDFLLISFQAIGSWFKGSESDPGIFTKALDAITKSAADLEEKLTGNTLSESLFAIAGQLRKMGSEGEAAPAIEGLNAITESAAATEAALNAAGDAAVGFSTGENMLGISDFLPDTGGVATASGEKIAGQITGVSAGIQGAQAGGPWGALIAVLTDFLLQNETFKVFIGELNRVLGELLAPAIESLVLILEPLVPLLQEFKPLFKTVADVIGFFTGHMATWIQVVAHWVKTTTEAFDDWTVSFNNLSEMISFLQEQIETWIQVVAHWIETTTDVFDNLAISFKGFTDAVNTIWKFIFDKLKPAFEKIAEIALNIAVFGAAIGSLVTVLNNLPNKIKEALNLNIGGGGDGGIKLPNLSKQTGLNFRTAGEQQTTQTPVTINVVALNPRAQAEEIRVLLEEMFLTGRLRVA